MDQEIRWSSPEYHHYQKDVGWYWLVIIIGVVLVAISLFQQNFLFAVFVVIAAALIINWGRRSPETIDFTLSDKGLDIGGKRFYPWNNLVGFAIVELNENQEINELVLRTQGRFTSWLKIIIASQRTENIKALLNKHIPEIEYEESLVEHIAKILRF